MNIETKLPISYNYFRWRDEKIPIYTNDPRAGNNVVEVPDDFGDINDERVRLAWKDRVLKRAYHNIIGFSRTTSLGMDYTNLVARKIDNILPAHSPFVSSRLYPISANNVVISNTMVIVVSDELTYPALNSKRWFVEFYYPDIVKCVRPHGLTTKDPKFEVGGIYLLSYEQRAGEWGWYVYNNDGYLEEVVQVGSPDEREYMDKYDRKFEFIGTGDTVGQHKDIEFYDL